MGKLANNNNNDNSRVIVNLWWVYEIIFGIQIWKKNLFDTQYFSKLSIVNHTIKKDDSKILLIYTKLSMYERNLPSRCSSACLEDLHLKCSVLPVFEHWERNNNINQETGQWNHSLFHWQLPQGKNIFYKYLALYNYQGVNTAWNLAFKTRQCIIANTMKIQWGLSNIHPWRWMFLLIMEVDAVMWIQWSIRDATDHNVNGYWNGAVSLLTALAKKEKTV